MECFWLSVMPILFDIIDRIYIICCSFVWNSNHRPVSWASMCYSKDESGISLRHLRSWNKSPLSKVIWDFQSDRNLFGFDGFIISTSLGLDIWTWTTKHSDYPTIKRVLQIRDKLLATADTPSLAATMLNLGLARALRVPIQHIRLPSS